MTFHLAIPSKDINESIGFYKKIGTLGRWTTTWAIFNVHGIQLVCHKWHSCDDRPTMYPRHFGFIIDDLADFDKLYNSLRVKEIPFFEDTFRRFKGEDAEHETFFIKDPSNNVIEFKWYKNKGSIFGA